VSNVNIYDKQLRPDKSIKTQSMPPASHSEILNTQRLRRPSSPHFTIYEPQITWIGSIANRMTGVGLSVRELNMFYFNDGS
jgi:succinate dehydrogenase (ubiquinone) cytochrome b560 subunit